jgi:hypothetical protein
VKIRFFISLIALALMLTTVATGQKRKQTHRAKPSPTPSPSPTPTPLSTLSIEVGLIYDNGDVKPVARTTFFLLDEDLRIILKPFDETPGTLGSEMDSLLSTSASSMVEKSYQEKAKAKYSKIKSAVESHIIATVTTDFTGKGKLESLTPGTRFVYGEFRVGQERVAWNLKVELKAGANTALTLDNNNRSY